MIFSILRMPGFSYHGPFLPLDSNEKNIRETLKLIVQILSFNIGERNIWRERSLDAAVEEISANFMRTGLILDQQCYRTNGIEVKNLIAEKTGNEKPEEIIIIGAHYDTVLGTPGADDNASGVAAVLVIANLLSNISLKRTVRFITFVNEEPPFFFTSNMGSYQYARQCRKNNENIVAMFSIESIGYYSEKRGTQSYPFPLAYFYPNTGNFIGFVSNVISRELVKDSIESFRKHTQFPSEGLFAPFFIPGVALSDQLSFWRHGYKAIMVTGTAYLRNPNYHAYTDLPDTLDYDRMARVVLGLSKVFTDLAQN